MKGTVSFGKCYFFLHSTDGFRYNTCIYETRLHVSSPLLAIPGNVIVKRTKLPNKPNPLWLKASIEEKQKIPKTIQHWGAAECVILITNIVTKGFNIDWVSNTL